ncbi:MAG TPA: HNH endonuclease [Chromatiales bacterium]|nr:HNH endonuclease [Chromatiales bacterium]
MRAGLERRYPDREVKGTVPERRQARQRRAAGDGVEVGHGASGVAVRVRYRDPLTGEARVANVPYDARGLPIFDDVARFTTRIDRSLDPEMQKVQASRELWKAIQRGEVRASQFTPRQLEQIRRGSKKIRGYTWHHNAQSSPPSMQLIPDRVHKKVTHIGDVGLNQGGYR